MKIYKLKTKQENKYYIKIKEIDERGIYKVISKNYESLYYMFNNDMIEIKINNLEKKELDNNSF
jgi:hypothetical protein